MRKANWLTGLATFLAAQAIFAGVGSSGGGLGVVCRREDGSIRSAELLDLYEAKVRYHKQLHQSKGELLADLIYALRVNYLGQGSTHEWDFEALAKWKRDTMFQIATFSEEKLPFLGDVGSTVNPPPGCGLEQVAIFKDAENDPHTGTLTIDANIWRAFSAQSQAALITHEHFYKFERLNRETTSETTRLFVALSYADGGTTARTDVPRMRRICEATDLESIDTYPRTAFYIYPAKDSTAEKPAVIWQMASYMMGRPMLSKTSIRLPIAEDSAESGVFDVPLNSEHLRGFQIQAAIENGNPVYLRLFRGGKQLAETRVQRCHADAEKAPAPRPEMPEMPESVVLGHGRIFDRNPTGALVDLPFLVSGRGTLANYDFATMFKAGSGLARARRSNYAFDFPQEDYRFLETTVFANANKMLGWFKEHGIETPDEQTVLLVDKDGNNAYLESDSAKDIWGRSLLLDVDRNASLVMSRSSVYIGGRKFILDGDVTASLVGQRVLAKKFPAPTEVTGTVWVGLAEFSTMLANNDACLAPTICKDMVAAGGACIEPRACYHTAENDFMINDPKLYRSNERSQVLSGLLWDIRTAMLADSEDFMDFYVEALRSLPDSPSMKQFVDTLLTSDAKTKKSRYARVIEEKAKKRGL